MKCTLNINKIKYIVQFQLGCCACLFTELHGSPQKNLFEKKIKLLMQPQLTRVSD